MKPVSYIKKIDKTQRIFFTSDLHFNHQKEDVYRDRGFNTTEEMTEAIVQRWNSVVSKDDIVYILGDVIMNTKEAEKYLHRLNGNIRIVRGNHDSDNKVSRYIECENVEEILFSDAINYKKYFFVLTHYPAALGDEWRTDSKFYNLHGHTHSKSVFGDMPHCFNVAVDAHDMTPIEITKVIEKIKERNKGE